MFFLYTKVTILSFISFKSFISGKDDTRKYAISVSQTIRLNYVNDTFRQQKQYVYENSVKYAKKLMRNSLTKKNSCIFAYNLKRCLNTFEH